MVYFTTAEKRDLALGTLLFIVVELSILILYFNIIPDIIIIAFLTAPLFLLHELAHKFTAQHYGLNSEFHLDPNLAIFSLFSIILPVKIIAPGAVVSSGEYRSDISARVSMAGPLVNILLGGLFLVISILVSPGWMSIPLYISKFSFDLAIFNLLPFFVLDGNKVFKWHTGVYAVIFGLTVVLWLFHPFGVFGAVYL